MKLATHNTMTYQKPKQLWCKILPFLARCQKVDYKKQHELGAEGFDLRIFWDKKGEIEFRHGLFRYPADELYDVLDYASDNNIIVRIMLELRTYNVKYVKNIDEIKERFVNFCKDIEERYPNIKFYGGLSTGPWEKLYKFKNEPKINEVSKYSSVTSLFVVKNKFLKTIDDLFPKLYAKWMNRQNIDEYSHNDDNTYLVIDFIDIK